MDTPTGGGRDSRFNMGYNMSLISGEASSEIYGNTGHSRPSTSLSSGVSRSSMSLPSTCGAGLQRGIKRTSSEVCFEQEVSGRPSMSSQGGMGMTECGTDLGDDAFSQAQKKTPPPNGKKTKGRVKIKMEYIDNKLRRYTTFSKRKTGIMKKAYELSTLTGTQVMLLVASETGHVYTFATRKLQPMITSEAGKALIQTCLNSPDPPPSGVGGDQRMSATGFEETELTYNIGDEEQKEEGMSPRSENGGGDSCCGGDSSGNESPATPDPRGSNGTNSEQHQHQQQQQQQSGGESRSPAEVPLGLPTTQPQLISASMMTPPYPGVMYQTSQGMVYAAAPTSALSNGVIFSLSQGQLQLQHPESGITKMVCDLSIPPSGPPQLHQENGGSFSKDEMGCGVSKKTMVVPVEEADPDRASDSEPSDDQIHESQEDVPKPTKAQAMAFEVPVNEESIIRKHPPRRLQRLEDQQAILSHELLDEKQEEAKQRRFQILTQRVRSAKRSSKRFLDNDISSQNDFQIETMKNENSTLEL